MAKDSKDQTNYIKRPVLEETSVPNVIQEPIKSPDTLFHFIKDVHDSTVPKMWGIYLNEHDCSIGNEVLALGINAEPKNFNIETIFHFYYVFQAKSLMLVTNHIHRDATPTEADKALIRKMESAKTLLESVTLKDYVGCRW